MTLTELETKRPNLVAICHRYGIVRLEAFGSVVRGEARFDSDVDLLAEFDSDDLGPWLSRLTSAQDAFQNQLGVQVDLLTRKGLIESARQEADREAVTLYVA
ncbi:nucleotidyltransferase family protein [soil metagenome]